MPYICLSRSDIPDGTVQILDLAPNSSQASAVYDGQGQTRYVNRAKNDPVFVTPLGTMVQNEAEGLRAYLADKVEPGGLEVAGGTITCVGPTDGDTFTLGAVPFTCVSNFATGTITCVAPSNGDVVTVQDVDLTCVENFATGSILVEAAAPAVADAVTIAGVAFEAVAAGPDPAAQEFLSAADNDAATSATSLATAINDAATQALIIAATGGAGVTGAADDVTVNLTSNTERGLTGAMTLASTDDYTLSGATMDLVLADPAAQEFDGALGVAGGAVALIAASLETCVDDAATQALIVAETGGPTVAATTALGVVTLTASVRGLLGQLTLATTDAVNLAISGATLDLTLADPAAQEFDGLLSVADNTAVAESIVATINNAASVVLVKAANATNYALASSALGVVTLAARDDAAAALPGPTGNLTLVSSSAVRLEINDGETVITRMFRTHEAWTVAFINATATALQARVDAGSAMTLAAIDVVLLAQAGAELTAAGGSNSVGVLTEILSVFAGRIYKLTRTTAAGVLNQIMTADNPTYEWNTNVLGGFTEAVTVWGDSWADGEVVPSVAGGATQNREVGNIRHTYDTGSFQISIASGDLFTFADGVTLWPDSDLGPHFPWSMQGAATATVTGARVVTVYDDSGNVLA